MVTNDSTGLNVLDLIELLYGLPGIGKLIEIGKAIGIAVLVYITFLIVKTITQILYSLRIKKLTKNVEEINKKMDLLIGSKIKKVKNKV
jgi:ABC-type anion transport system duplicated permease subunit